MSKNSLFNKITSTISVYHSRLHLTKPSTPYKIIVDEQANLLVFMTKREYKEYIESRDLELCRY